MPLCYTAGGHFFMHWSLMVEYARRRFNLTIPWGYGHLVCNCKETPRRLDRDLTLRCSICRGFPKYKWRVCMHCEDYFFDVFSHPFKCSYQDVCWECLEKEREPLCEGHPDKTYDSCQYTEARTKNIKTPPPYVDMTERSREFNLTEITF